MKTIQSFIELGILRDFEIMPSSYNATNVTGPIPKLANTNTAASCLQGKQFHCS